MTRLERNLRENSIEAFVLALEVINKISLSYRIESFIILFCNAWELLIKAKLLKDKRKIFYRKQKNQLKRSLSLDDCLSRVFTAENDPVRLNIKKIQELRDHATHLVIPFIPLDAMGLFQAGVINYTKKLTEWLGVDITRRVPLGMMALVYDIDPSLHAFDTPLIKRKLPNDTLQWWKLFQASVRDQAESLAAGREKFYIPINLKLAIVKNPNKADIVLNSGTVGESACIVEVAKDSDNTHPHRQKDVVRLVNQRSSHEKQIGPYDIVCVRRKFKIDENKKFYYKSKFASPQYSDTFVDWLIEQYESDFKFFINARTN